MYEPLGSVVLKNGETVEAGVVVAPDLDWADRMEKLLGGSGGIWNWQNRTLLRDDVGIEAYYYILHRDGTTLANIMTAEVSGVGILGHVWTEPADRRKGAMRSLMQRQMEHFRQRGGRALYLGTDFENPAYQIYQRGGFRSAETRSGYMHCFATSREEFEATYFDVAEVEMTEVDWPHWPSSPALFMGDFPGTVRLAPLRLVGRVSSEYHLLPLIRDEGQRRRDGTARRAKVLQGRGSSAVLGLAVWDWHPLWPGIGLVDVYCHPKYWGHAGGLVTSLELPEADGWVAYADSECEPKLEVLKAAGFDESFTRSERVFADPAKRRSVDLIELVRARR